MSPLAVGLKDGCAYDRLKAFWKASFDFENAEVVDRKGVGFRFALGVEEWNARRIDDGLENCLNTCCETANGLLARNDIFGDRSDSKLMDEKENELIFEMMQANMSCRQSSRRLGPINDVRRD